MPAPSQLASRPFRLEPGRRENDRQVFVDHQQQLASVRKLWHRAEDHPLELDGGLPWPRYWRRAINSR